MKNILLSTLLFLICGDVYSQSDVSFLYSLLADDSSSIQVLFSYPDSIRHEALIASTYPQGFTRLSEVQKISSTSFSDLISPYNRNKQNQIWNIARYPELPALLIANKDKPEKELSDILKNYPVETRKASQYFMKHDYNALVRMRDIQSKFESDHINAMQDFPFAAQRSFDILLRYPELFSVLAGDMKTTVMTGDLYKRNPVMVERVTDSIYQQRTKEYGTTYEDWKKGIKNDPAVQKDLQELSKKYQKDEGSKETEDDVYATGKEEYQSESQAPVEVLPYPYWAGYPYWYDIPYWYPYPWWYHTGFYWFPGGSIAFFGLPTYHFGWWYYNHPRYYNRYPNFYHYYEGHLRSNGGFNRQWNGGGRGFYGGRGGGFGGGRRR